MCVKTKRAAQWNGVSPWDIIDLLLAIHFLNSRDAKSRHGSVFCKIPLYLASVSFDPYDDIHRLLLKNLYLDVRNQLEEHKVIYSNDHYFVERRHNPHSVLYFERNINPFIKLDCHLSLCATLNKVLK
jgi:hypothetical protein